MARMTVRKKQNNKLMIKYMQSESRKYEKELRLYVNPREMRYDVVNTE
jgi:hypothetical protein